MGGGQKPEFGRDTRWAVIIAGESKPFSRCPQLKWTLPVAKWMHPSWWKSRHPSWWKCSLKERRASVSQWLNLSMHLGCRVFQVSRWQLFLYLTVGFSMVFSVQFPWEMWPFTKHPWPIVEPSPPRLKWPKHYKIAVWTAPFPCGSGVQVCCKFMDGRVAISLFMRYHCLIWEKLSQWMMKCFWTRRTLKLQFGYWIHFGYRFIVAWLF